MDMEAFLCMLLGVSLAVGSAMMAADLDDYDGAKLRTAQGGTRIVAPILLFGQYQDGDYTFTLDEDGAVIARYTVRTGETPSIVQVPETLSGYPVVAIGKGGFNNDAGDYDGKAVDEIILPKTLKRLEPGAFDCCHDVRKIRFPASLESIPVSCFQHAIAEIVVDMENPYFYVQDGFLIDRRTNTLLYTYSPDVPDPLVLPDVEYILSGAIENLSSKSSITLPQTLKCISSYTFYDAINLTELYIPDNVIELEPFALAVTSLFSVRLPKSLRHIPAACFDGSFFLKQIEIPDTVETIGEYAFYDTALSEVFLPPSVRFVGYRAFSESVNVLYHHDDIYFEHKEAYEARMDKVDLYDHYGE